MANRSARSEGRERRSRSLYGGALSCSRVEAVISADPLTILSRYGSRHGTAEADAFGDSSVFGIIETGIGDLEAFDWGLNGRNFCSEARLADGLAVLESSDFGGEDVVFG